MRFPGIIPAVTTPFDTSGAVDTAALEGNVTALLDAGVHGIVATGTMGEAGSLSNGERRTVVAAVMDQPLWQRLRDESVAVPGRARLHAAEHRMIYEAIVDGDAEAAAFYATQHIQRVRRYMTLE